MNTASANLNPVNAVQAQPAAGKQLDSAAADTPFSQVLSSEIAQHQRSHESRAQAEAKSKTKSDAASEPADAAQADTTATVDPASVKLARDPLAALQPDETEDSALTPLPDGLPAMPDAMLALALHPDLLKPAPAATGSVSAEDGAALGADVASALDADLLDSRKASAQSALTAGQPGEEATGTAKLAAQPTGQAALQASGTASSTLDQATAVAFAEKLAAARQSEDMQAGERVSELLSNPAMQTGPRAASDPAAALNSVASSHLAPSVGSTAWSEAVGEKIVWMAAGAQQSASLTLNPPNMGPLQIVLNISNDQATASFFSAQPEVRQALEAAFPKLREMMNEAGIQLGQATVSADTPRQHDTPERQSQRIAMPFAETDNAPLSGLQPMHAPVRQSGRGLVDTFA